MVKLLYHTDGVSWISNELRVNRCAVAECISLEGAFMLPHEILLGDDADLADVVRAFRKVLNNPSEAAGLVDRMKDRAKRLLGNFRYFR